MSLNHDLISAFPKVELHVHVESCISAEKIEQIAQELDIPMLRPRDQLFKYSSLAEFLEVYEWWCGLLRTPEIAEQIAYDAAVMLHKDGIVYAEVLMGPRYWEHIDYAPLILALGKGYERAFQDGYTDCRITPSISREQSVEWSFELVEWMAKERPNRVVGLGLDGNEELLGRTCSKFESVFDRAHEVGLGRTAHSGESSGPEGVWDAINYLKLDRIDHGVRGIEDPELVKLLADNQIPLNICPTSNIVTGVYSSIPELPIAPFIEAGVPVTINSDDPKSMNTSLSNEFLKVGEHLDWSVDDLSILTRNAIDAAFCEESKAKALHRQVDEFMSNIV